MFDCQTCAVADALDALWPENLDAWSLFQRLMMRFVVDAGLCAEVFRASTRALGPDDRVELVERVALLYDVCCPPPAKT